MAAFAPLPPPPAADSKRVSFSSPSGHGETDFEAKHHKAEEDQKTAKQAQRLADSSPRGDLKKKEKEAEKEPTAAVDRRVINYWVVKIFTLDFFDHRFMQYLIVQGRDPEKRRVVVGQFLKGAIELCSQPAKPIHLCIAFIDCSDPDAESMLKLDRFDLARAGLWTPYSVPESSSHSFQLEGPLTKAQEAGRMDMMNKIDEAGGLPTSAYDKPVKFTTYAALIVVYMDFNKQLGRVPSSVTNLLRSNYSGFRGGCLTPDTRFTSFPILVDSDSKRLHEEHKYLTLGTLDDYACRVINAEDAPDSWPFYKETLKLAIDWEAMLARNSRKQKREASAAAAQPRKSKRLRGLAPDS